MRIYFAAPLFSAAERGWNASLAEALQEQEPGKGRPGHLRDRRREDRLG